MKKKLISMLLTCVLLMPCLTAFASAQPALCSLDLTVDGDGSVEACLDGRWQELPHESGSWNLPVGEEIQFRCFSTRGELYRVYLDDAPLGFQRSDTDPQMWTFSFIPEGNWAHLYLIFEAYDAVDIDLLTEGPGVLYFYQNGEWTYLEAGNNAFSVDNSDSYTTFRAQPSEEGCAAVEITFDGTAIPPSAYTPEGTEFHFETPAAPGTLLIKFGLANLVSMPDTAAAVVEVNIGGTWIPARSGAPVPTGSEALLGRLLPAAGTRITALFLNEEELELSPVEDEDMQTFLFEIPAEANGLLRLEDERDTFLIETAPDAPEDIVMQSSERYGELLTGLICAPQAVPVADVLSWLNVPEYAVLSAETPLGEAAGAADAAGTGTRILANAGDGETLASCTLLMAGDVTGTGVLNIAQVVRMARALTGEQPLDGLFALAADLNGSGMLDISDVVREAQRLSGGAA